MSTRDTALAMACVYACTELRHLDETANPTQFVSISTPQREVT